MRQILVKLAVVVVWLVGAILVCIRLTLDVIGFGSLPEDLPATQSRLYELLEYIYLTPWWFPWVSIFFLIIVLFLFIQISSFNQGNGGPTLEENTEPPRKILYSQDVRALSLEEDLHEETGVYEGVHEKLMLFTCNYLLPSCDLLLRVQESAIRDLCTNGLISNFAVEGAKPRSFSEHVQRLSTLGDSPASFIPFDEMIERIDIIEKNYHGLPVQIGLILLKSGVKVESFINDHSELYEKWREAHKAMVEEFESIKKDSKMKSLFRPMRESRWGPSSIPQP